MHRMQVYWYQYVNDPYLKATLCDQSCQFKRSRTVKKIHSQREGISAVLKKYYQDIFSIQYFFCSKIQNGRNTGRFKANLFNRKRNSERKQFFNCLQNNNFKNFDFDITWQIFNIFKNNLLDTFLKQFYLCYQIYYIVYDKKWRPYGHMTLKKVYNNAKSYI